MHYRKDSETVSKITFRKIMFCINASVSLGRLLVFKTSKDKELFRIVDRWKDFIMHYVILCSWLHFNFVD